MENLVFIGDSLTEYFDWQRRFPAYNVLNLGVSGETIEGLETRIDRILLAVHDPDVIFIMTGINNIAMEDFDILQTYKQIINRLFSSYKKAIIVVQGLLPLNLSWIDNARIREINTGLEALAKNFTAGYLDVYSLFCDAAGTVNPACLLDDGVHLSDRGYEVWSNAVECFLRDKKP
ncbi:MAG: GDSL family lipase [Nitrospirae bacterium]|nr:MAG: GDSL family lipase [Nitrospirota bacterium]